MMHQGISSNNKTLRLVLPALPFVAFIIGLCSATMLPGVYMDAVYPDYLVPRLLSGNPENSLAWIAPGNIIFGYFPILGNIYQGALPFWIGLPFYALFGTDVVGIRVTHAIFAALIIASAWKFLRAINVPTAIVSLALSAMALDPAFHFAFRTQFAIAILPVMFVLVSATFAFRSLQTPIQGQSRLILASGFLAGLSVYGYFFYLFYAGVIGLFIMALHRLRNVFIYGLGCMLGMLPILYGLIAYVYTQGGISSLLERSDSLTPFSAASSLTDRISHIYEMVRLNFTGDAVTLMMMGELSSKRLLLARIVILLAIPFAALILSLFARSRLRLMILMFAFLILPPVLYGIVFGDRLWAHHFIPVIPILYCAAAVGIHVLTSSIAILGSYRSVANGLLMILCFVNAVNFQGVIARLVTTGGVGMYSDSINRFADDVRGDKALYLMPDWGLTFPVTMITRSSIQIRDEFDAKLVVDTLCSRRDVVLASIGPDAETKSDLRLKSVAWPVATSAIYRQRDGKPWIYVDRWNASPSGKCN